MTYTQLKEQIKPLASKYYDPEGDMTFQEYSEYVYLLNQLRSMFNEDTI